MKRFPRTTASLLAVVALVIAARSFPAWGPVFLAITAVGVVAAMCQERFHAHG